MSRSRTVSLAPEDSDILFNLDLCEAGVHQGDDDRSDEEYALDRAREAKDLYPRTFAPYDVPTMAADYLHRL